MSNPMVYIKFLEEAGFQRSQAEAQVQMVLDVLEGDLVTKSDFNLQQEKLEGRFTRLDGRLDQIDHKFEMIDARFEQVDKRFEQIDKRFEQVDKQFEAVDKRFEQIDKRFEQVDKQFEAVDKRFEQMNKRFDHMDKRFDQMGEVVGSLIKAAESRLLINLGKTIVGSVVVMGTIIGFLLKG